MSLRWEPLREGDVVDIIAPAFPTESTVLIQAQEFLKSWNLVPRIPKNLLKKTLLFSNTDKARAEHLKAALKSDSKVIWCLRGGYGAIRLLPELAKMSRPKKAKLLIGISDVTSLNIYLNKNWNWPVLHGPLMDRMALNKVPAPILKELKKILFGEQDQIEFKNLKALNSKARSGKKVSAPVVGGNLVTLQSSIATPYDFDFKNKIAFFEEIGERGYKIDRILVHLSQAGYFKNCKGVVFGHLTGGDEPDGKNTIKQVLKAWADEQKFPVYSGIESGHGVNLRPLPLGTQAVLEGNKLVVETGV